MEIIVFEKESFYRLIDELTVRIIKNTEKHFKQAEWISEPEAKKLLGVKSRSKMQQLRDEIKIEFSQFGKIIRYSRSSIMKFLEQNRISLDNF
ncbi:MAG: helix-turn-helix domain-containing protein [Crocinitomicaceae bacterium]|nr:helix-turn-helix domain-containing protein [Crocinitomicaceae bacterium]